MAEKAGPEENKATRFGLKFKHTLRDDTRGIAPGQLYLTQSEPQYPLSMFGVSRVIGAECYILSRKPTDWCFGSPRVSVCLEICCTYDARKPTAILPDDLRTNRCWRECWFF